LIPIIVQMLGIDEDLGYIMTGLLSKYSHFFNEDYLRLVIHLLLKKNGIKVSDHEAKISLGRKIVDSCKCPTCEIKEDVAISLFPYFGALYPREEMPRLAGYGFV
jgi:hypothetical protein